MTDRESRSDGPTPEPTASDPRSLVATMPYAVALGITVDEATPERVRGRLEWAPERCTAGGILHGAALMSLADSLGGICAYLNLPTDATTATVEGKTSFFRAVRDGTLHAVARPLHVGGRFIVVQTELTDDQGRSVAHTTQTQAVLDARG